MNDLMEHLMKLIETDESRFSFEFSCGNTMEIFDKEKEIGYVICTKEIKYDENGNAINL